MRWGGVGLCVMISCVVCPVCVGVRLPLGTIASHGVWQTVTTKNLGQFQLQTLYTVVASCWTTWGPSFFVNKQETVFVTAQQLLGAVF